jgi:hypothetical protein
MVTPNATDRSVSIEALITSGPLARMLESLVPPTLPGAVHCASRVRVLRDCAWSPLMMACLAGFWTAEHLPTLTDQKRHCTAGKSNT